MVYTIMGKNALNKAIPGMRDSIWRPTDPVKYCCIYLLEYVYTAYTYAYLS